MKEKDNYSESKTFTYPGVVAKVYSPILTDEERQRRMARITRSAEKLLTQERKANEEL